jgi:hypothetical protein
MWHHGTNHLIISNDKDSNSEMNEKLRVHDNRYTRVCDLLYSSDSALKRVSCVYKLTSLDQGSSSWSSYNCHPVSFLAHVNFSSFSLYSSALFPYLSFLQDLLVILLVEVLLCLLTLKGDLVYHDLVSKAILSYMLHHHSTSSKSDNT